MLNSEKIAPAVADSFRELIATLLTEEAVPASFSEQVEYFKRLKSELGRKQLADRLGVSVDELSFFEAAVAAAKLGQPPETAGSQPEKNKVLAQLRLFSWLETIASRQRAFVLSPQVEALVSEDMGRKRIRALELVIRDLVGERHGDQQGLANHLRSIFGNKVVDRWATVADPNDLLSGTTFSELASIFVNKEEFTHHQRLYEDADVLTLLKERRTTVQSFLEDIRRIRNTMAHNKKISNIQLSLLDLYYDELISPVDAAHRRGETRVNPQAFLEVSGTDLVGYFDNLREDVMAVQEDLADLKQAVEQRFSEVQAQTGRIEAATSSTNKKLLIGLAGLLLLIGGVGYAIRQGQTVIEQGEGTQQGLANLGASTAAIQQSTAELGDKANRLVDSSERIEAKTEELLKSNQVVVQSLETIQAGFDSLSKSGGIIAEPTLPQEVYHNARLYEQQGDYGKARQSYVRFFSFNLDLVDPHLRYQTFLKLQEGRTGAREIYRELTSKSTNWVTKFASILLQEPEQRLQQLEAFAQQHPSFAPVFYQLSQEFSQSRLGEQAMTDKAAEYKHLQTFLELHQRGEYLKYMLDQQLADSQLNDAHARLEPLKTISAAAMENPVTISGMMTNSGWMLNVQISGQVKEIFVRHGETGDFQSTGHMQYKNPQTGFPLPNTTINLDKDLVKTTFVVKYLDSRDREQGPFSVTFNPQTELIQSQKKILEQLPQAWASFRDYDGKTLVYFSHLFAYRSAIDEIKYGLDKEQPDTRYRVALLTETGVLEHHVEFGPRDPERPGALLEKEMPYFTVPSTTKFITVQLKYKDGTMSEIQRFKR